MTKTLFLSLLVTVGITATKSVIAQELLTELPETKEALIASEKKLLATIDWLEANTYKLDDNQLAAQRELLLAWLTNSPTVTIEFHEDMISFTKKNPELLFVFMGGWTKYCLQNNYSKDLIQGNLAGIKSVIDIYKKRNLKKNKNIEKLIKLDEKGQLERYIRDALHKK